MLNCESSVSNGLIGAPCGVPFPSSRLRVLRCLFPAWVYTPAARAAVDTFYFSARASVRPTTSSTRTLRCPQTFGRLRLLLRGLLCNIHRRMPSRLLGAPCRTEHRSETWAIPSLCRATPSATSERLVELLASSLTFMSKARIRRFCPVCGHSEVGQQRKSGRSPSPNPQEATARLLTRQGR